MTDDNIHSMNLSQPDTTESSCEDAASVHHRNLETLEGEIISGRYQIVRRIGRGGMGVVYVAQQTNLNRNVCIKVLNPALLDDADAVGRFEREAKGLSRLQHPNIVTIFDYGRDAELAYIVMEYAQGLTLSKYIKANSPLEMDVFLPIAVQILKGIGEAHKLGLIHRDIKPANIILSELEGEQNYVKILDFGLAKLVQGQEDLTREQQLVGSASYMAPEQITTGQSDTRTDVYSLGVMFYLMLTGKKPFTGPNDNIIMYKHVNETPVPLFSLINSTQNIPETLCEVIDQCLNKDPDKRPQTATDLLNAISYALDAPQLRAGYSSMTMTAIEIHKPAEETETNELIVSDSVQEIAQIPQSAAISAFMSADSKIINSADSSSVSLRYVSNHSKGLTHEKKIMLILLAAIITTFAIITAVLIKNNSDADSDPISISNSNTDEQNVEAPNADMITPDDYQTLEKHLNSHSLDMAEDFIKTLETKSNANTDDNRNKLNEYKNSLTIERLIDKAKLQRSENHYPEARETYHQLESFDKKNAMIGNMIIDALESEARYDCIEAQMLYQMIKDEHGSDGLSHYPEIDEYINRINEVVNNSNKIILSYNEDRNGIKLSIKGSNSSDYHQVSDFLPEHMCLTDVTYPLELLIEKADFKPFRKIVNEKDFEQQQDNSPLNIHVVLGQNKNGISESKGTRTNRQGRRVLDDRGMLIPRKN